MEPALAPGSYVLVDVARAPVVGDIVVFRPPAPWRLATRPAVLIKRVEDRDGTSLWVRSDNRRIKTVDSWQFGLVSDEDVVGPVSWMSRQSLEVS